MTDEQLKRLNDLSALRERGVLSEAEFQRAKRRLLGEAPAAPVGGSGGGLGLMQGRMRWVTIGGAVTVAVILLWLLLGRREADDGTEYAIENAAMTNGTMSAADGEMLCASPVVHGQLKDRIFTEAIAAHRGDTEPLVSLQRSVGVRMDYPLFRSASQDGQRLTCSGHLILDLPPTVREAFDGAAALESDVGFALQPEGEGARVVDASNIAYTIQRLVAAAALANRAQTAKTASGSSSPSFACSEDLSDVERMICDDGGLARLDRDVADRFGRLSEGLPMDRLAGLEQSQRAFLRRRNQCADPACVRDAYIDQARTLETFNENATSSNPS